MMWFGCKRVVRILLFLACLLIPVFGLSAVSFAQQAAQGVVWDLPMRIPSPEETSSWFPDLAVDGEGRVHVVWNETNHQAMGHPKPGDYIERVYYSMWDGQQWSQANDIVPPQVDIIRNAIAVDGYDMLHLVFGWQKLYYKQTQANAALSAANWSSPRLVNGRGSTYMSDIAVYQDTLHIVYDDAGAEEGECPNCADIFYRHSTDRGLTWSAPVALLPTGTGSSRAQIEIDKKGVVYLAWDEGWDRFTGQGDPQYGVYMYSLDSGNTWSSPASVSYPNSTNAQLSVGADGQGGVMLVWRTISAQYPGIYYMWSKDYGTSWFPPQMLPDIVARRWETPFDVYDMATDSAGHIHLLVVGYLSTESVAPDIDQGPPGLYHFEWDGKSWSLPSRVYEGGWYPEYPHMVIDRGNQLHTTWFIREDPWNTVPPYQIWYAHGQSQAPAETPVMGPTITPTHEPEVVVTPKSTPTSVPTLPPTPTPTLDPGLTQGSVPPGITESIYTETDDLVLLVKSLIPAALVIAVVVIGVRAWRR
jgi:hypothetical protein